MTNSTATPTTTLNPTLNPTLTPTIPTPPIRLIPNIPPLRLLRRECTLNSRTIALIPTMGALHSGHLSLIRAAAHQHPILIVSIFVNPAQFSPTEDLSTYPRTLSSDLSQLESLNAEFDALDPTGTTLGRIHAVFNPTVDVLYPAGIPLVESEQKGAFVTVHKSLGGILEGVSRPHFFRGVATAVTKLLNIVQPDTAYFGQKDVQQTVVIKTLVRDLCFATEVVVAPTVRDEADGLALSSRNVYLGEKRRRDAGCLYKALKAAERVYRDRNVGQDGATAGEMLEKAREVLRDYVEKGVVEIEYLSLADGEEMREFCKDEKVKEGAVLSAAIRMLPREEGQRTVRLIDNIIL